MTTTQAHATATAFGERLEELRRWRRWYDENPVGRNWTDLASENAIRLDELERIERRSQAMANPETEAENRVLWGNR